MLTLENGKILVKKQFELDRLIVEKSQTNLKGFSLSNAERLKLALLVEVGEFANEIKSFKAGQKKPEIDGIKAKEELIDCLGYFIGLCSIYQIDFLLDFSEENSEDLSFNKLLLKFFYKTSDLFIIQDEYGYKLEATKITEKKELATYFEGGKVFNQICQKLKISEQELLEIYLKKSKINQQRAQEK